MFSVVLSSVFYRYFGVYLDFENFFNLCDPFIIMVRCSVPSCGSDSLIHSKKISGITFHRFPKDPLRRRRWIEFVGRANWEPTKNNVLCSKHFLEQYMDRTSLNLVRLKDDAVPTINQNVSSVSKKMKILSHIVIRPTTDEIEVVASTSASTLQERPVTPLKSVCGSNPISPRKRLLINKLHRIMKINNERKKQIALLKRKLLRNEKRIASLKDVMTDLLKKRYMPAEAVDLLSKLGGPHELFSRQLKKSKGKAVPKQYSSELKVFALTLHYYSPAAYNYVRRTFNTCLPHSRTISRWYQSLNGEPGFTAEAFEALRLKAASSPYPVICGLIFDEMAIRQHEEWDPNLGKSYGYVDMGTGVQENNLAKDALVLLLNCVNGNWKIPVGYFLIAGITGEQKKGLVLDCLKKCFNVGIKVVSVTFDGAPSNITMANSLGCKLVHNNLKVSFQHPCCDEQVVVFLDPPHMLKLIRNTLGVKYSFVTAENELIEWKYFEKLHLLQKSESFHLANKLREQHVDYKKQKMKVSLATQLFSDSVATSLDFCGNVLKLEEFKDVQATIKFVRMMNNLFDILNSRNLKQLSYKKPLSESNYENVCTFLDKVDAYVGGLKTHTTGPLLLDTNRHTGFLGLKVCIASCKFLYSSLILKNKYLKCLPLYKICQDNLELFFCSIRAHGGYNNNPTVRQFQSAYKKLLVHVEVRESFRGNCIPLEELSILKCSAVKQINVTSREFQLSGLDDSDDLTIIMDHDYIPSTISEYSEYIITYIAGYVVYHLNKKIVCESCVTALKCETRDLFSHSFIDIKTNIPYSILLRM